MNMKKWRTIYSSITKYIGYLLAFVIPFSVLLIVFAVRGIYPFGEASFAFGDMGHQYIPFARELIRKVKEGESLYYSFNIGLGENFLAIYAYYLASPLQWLSLLCPEKYLIEFMSYMAIVKVGLSSVTVYFYLKRREACHNQIPGSEKQDKVKLVYVPLLFSVFYALSAYTAAYSWNTMWLDCFILLPLIIYGLEKLFFEGKGILYCICLGLCILTNYYISIMVCIFLVLYFTVLMINSDRKYPWKKTAGSFVGYSVLAAGLCSAVLIPGVMGVYYSADIGGCFPEKITQYFGILDMISRHCIGVTTELSLEHWPNVYMGVMCFLLLPLYALNKNLTLKCRVSNLALVAFMAFSFSNNMLDYLWHGLNVPNSLPAREAFLYIFLLLIICQDAFTGLKDVKLKQIGIICFINIVIQILCYIFVNNDNFPQNAALWTMSVICVYGIIFSLYIKSEKTKNLWIYVLVVTVFLESGANMLLTGIYTINRTSYVSNLEEYENLYNELCDEDDSFFRVEKFTRNGKNDGTLAGYRTASGFSSTINGRVSAFYEKMGMPSSDVQYHFDGATSLISALLNVKYMFSDTLGYGNELYELTKQGDNIRLYERMDAVDFGYVLPYGYDITEYSEDNPFELQNRIAHDLTGEESDLYVKVDEDYNKISPTLKADGRGIYYVLMEDEDTLRLIVKGGSPMLQPYKDMDFNTIAYVGKLEEDVQITLINGMTNDETPAFSASLYRQNEEMLEKTIDVLSAKTAENVDVGDKNVSVKISLDSPGRVVLSIPYDKGWKAYIDGQKFEINTFADCFMAFDMPAGEHEIQLEFTPTGMYLGRVISIVSLLILVVILIQRKRYALAMK